MPTRQRLTRQTWIEAALVALAERGVAGVAVEPLAQRLGSTKGSFYWHFADRDALLLAALEQWEQAQTEAVIERLQPLEAGPERLEALLRLTVARSTQDLSVRLGDDAEHPLVAPVLLRVTRRRIQYLAALLVEGGLPPLTADRRAHLTYAVYLGWSHLHRTVLREHALDQEELDAYVAELLRVLDRPHPSSH